MHFLINRRFLLYGSKVHELSLATTAKSGSLRFTQSARTFSGSLARFDDRPSNVENKPRSKLPRWAQKYAHRFKDNPASHLTSFLILHELTAVVPLPILFWFFHSFDWTPESLPTEYIEKGAQVASKQLQKWGMNYTGDDGTRYLFEGAAAYAVVKMILPLRVAASLSLTPWFARRIVVPITKIFRRGKVESRPPSI